MISISQHASISFSCGDIYMPSHTNAYTHALIYAEAYAGKTNFRLCESKAYTFTGIQFCFPENMGYERLWIRFERQKNRISRGKKQGSTTHLHGLKIFYRHLLSHDTLRIQARIIVSRAFSKGWIHGKDNMKSG
jgi:hypothetical protein